MSSSQRASSLLTVNDLIKKTKQNKEQGVRPSGPEFVAYARYLGIDPVVDFDLLWIAEEALTAPLPPDWTEHVDTQHRIFYFNVASRTSSWTHPLESSFRSSYEELSKFRGGQLSNSEMIARVTQLQHEIEDSERELERDLSAWSEHVDSKGHPFFFNKESSKSTWTDPRPLLIHSVFFKKRIFMAMTDQLGAGEALEESSDVFYSLSKGMDAAVNANSEKPRKGISLTGQQHRHHHHHGSCKKDKVSSPVPPLPDSAGNSNHTSNTGVVPMKRRLEKIKLEPLRVSSKNP